MNLYEIIVYDDRPNANPSKLRFEYEAADQHVAREFGQKTGSRALNLLYSEEKHMSVHVEFRKQLESYKIPIQDNAQSRLVIAHSVIEQCNNEEVRTEEEFWNRFVEIFNDRVGDDSGLEVSVLFKEILKNN